MFTTAISDSTGVLQLCNQALAHLGITTEITSLSDGSREADACARYLPMSLDDVLREWSWPFANVVELLSQMGQTIITWDYLYTYPTSAVTIHAVFDEGSTDTRFQKDYEITYLEGTTLAIASNLDDAYVEYTKRVTNAEIWDAKFTKALSYYLAASMAKQLTGDDKVATGLMQIYGGYIAEAKRTSGAEKLKQPEQKQGYVDAR